MRPAFRRKYSTGFASNRAANDFASCRTASTGELFPASREVRVQMAARCLAAPTLPPRPRVGVLLDQTAPATADCRGRSFERRLTVAASGRETGLSSFPHAPSGRAHVRRCSPLFASKHPVEIRQVLEADLEGDIGNLAVSLPGLAQQLHDPRQPLVEQMLGEASAGWFQ
jgi:hypothetical protein